MNNNQKLDYPKFKRILDEHFSFFHIISLWKLYQNDEETFFKTIRPEHKELILSQIIQFSSD